MNKLICDLPNCNKPIVNNHVVVIHEVMHGGEVISELNKNFHRACSNEYLAQCDDEQFKLNKRG